MTSAHEEDVVIAFRQAVQEEMQKMQRESASGRKVEDIFAGGASLEEALRRLSHRCDQLEHEVALLRTIVLRLVSEPVDRQDAAPAA